MEALHHLKFERLHSIQIASPPSLASIRSAFSLDRLSEGSSDSSASCLSVANAKNLSSSIDKLEQKQLPLGNTVFAAAGLTGFLLFALRPLQVSRLILFDNERSSLEACEQVIEILKISKNTPETFNQIAKVFGDLSPEDKNYCLFESIFTTAAYYEKLQSAALEDQMAIVAFNPLAPDDIETLCHLCREENVYLDLIHLKALETGLDWQSTLALGNALIQEVPKTPVCPAETLIVISKPNLCLCHNPAELEVLSTDAPLQKPASIRCPNFLRHTREILVPLMEDLSIGFLSPWEVFVDIAPSLKQIIHDCDEFLRYYRDRFHEKQHQLFSNLFDEFRNLVQADALCMILTLSKKEHLEDPLQEIASAIEKSYPLLASAPFEISDLLEGTPCELKGGSLLIKALLYFESILLSADEERDLANPHFMAWAEGKCRLEDYMEVVFLYDIPSLIYAAHSKKGDKTQSGKIQLQLQRHIDTLENHLFVAKQRAGALNKKSNS